MNNKKILTGAQVKDYEFNCFKFCNDKTIESYIDYLEEINAVFSINGDKEAFDFNMNRAREDYLTRLTTDLEFYNFISKGIEDDKLYIQTSKHSIGKYVQTNNPFA